MGGFAVESSFVSERGLQHDRRFMLIDENNRFLTQREYPQMALLQTAIEKDHLLVFEKKSPQEKLVLPLHPKPSSQNTTVKIWDDDCEAQLVSEEVDQWFSKKLQKNCRLVFMPDSTERKVDKKYASNDEIVSFADGYPILTIGQASLDDLNSRLAETLPASRFRPNIVFTGGTPFQEDKMEHFKINELDFFGVKPSARCVVTTINQETGSCRKRTFENTFFLPFKKQQSVFRPKRFDER